MTAKISLVGAVLALLLSIAAAAGESLCLSCNATNLFAGYCINCNVGGCAAYAQLNAGLCECRDMYYLAQTSAGLPYCDRCHVGCLSCSGPLSTNCLTCPPEFTYDGSASTCTPPSTSQDVTLDQLYNFYNYGLQSSWSWTSTSSSYLYLSALTINCNWQTFIGLAHDISLQGTYSTPMKHFSVRVMFAHYYFYSSSTSENIRVRVDGTNYDTPIEVDLTTSYNPAFSCGPTSQAIKTMVDKSYSHSASSLVLQLSTTDPNNYNYYWGVTEITVILKLCHSDCSSCTDYTSYNCTGCTDTDKIYNQAGYVGQCLCYGTSSYLSLKYQETTSGACVLLCPALPVETFGDNTTRTCVAQCPNNSYAYADVYRCWADCPTSSIVTQQLLFKDSLNWKCVTRCPSGAPYAYADASYRACYLNCPNLTNTVSFPRDTYAVDGLNARCVDVCPYNSSFQLFGYQGKCIPLCPVGTWGDPTTKLCKTTCASAAYPFKDSSSGQNICVQNCSYPDWFRDNTTSTCVMTCPGTTFGETNRECVTRCKDGEYGLPFGNRKCAAYCPEGYWAEPDNNVCVNDPNACNATFNRYADNYTRKCVFPQQCSLGYYAENNTQTCVPQCPTASSPSSIAGASVGDPFSKVCQAVCNGSYFADYVAGLCVLHCVTNQTYTDVDSGYRCVSSCNTAGSTPYKDNSTWTCVSDCNNTGIANFLRDSTTWMCVFNCPANYYADFLTTNNPICRATCLSGTYADNSTGTGLCVYRCSVYPPRFGDATGGLNLCVEVCTVGLYGDQTGNRTCINYCPLNYFAQNDTARQCVTKCKSGTYGQNRWCNDNPFNCTSNTFANDANNLCDGCSAVQATWGDPTTKRCVTLCPLNTAAGPVTYYADISIRQCVLTCSASYNTSNPTTYSSALWGNNQTRTCVFVCSDLNSFVQAQTSNPYRVCVARCHPAPIFHYANNQTKVCGVSIDCPFNQFGQNTTQTCVAGCPAGTFGYKTTADKICIDFCPLNWYGDNSTGVNLCVQDCPAIPSLFKEHVSKLCLPACPSPYYADSSTRSCVLACPLAQPLYAYEPTRTCLSACPQNYFGKFTNENLTGLPLNSNISRCVTPASACGANLYADPYLHMCVALCSGPTPVSLYGHWPNCVSKCPDTYYANTYNGARICTQLCPPGITGTTGAPNLYGDPSTITCVSRCVTPLTWADYQTRLCQSTCSATPIATYSQNFNFTCVVALSCPLLPSMTFGDNNTRSCGSNCTLGKFGDPTSRNCVTQCPNTTTTGTSTYYSDISTGQYLCVVICPILPRLFGLNSTNQCVDECPAPLYGDQTGNRTCLSSCPKISLVVHYAQNSSRICVTVCMTGTWGYQASRGCVQSPWDCQSQWADNSTNLCVDVCPASVGTFADPTTKFCVPLCPPTYYSDYTTRTCVQKCPGTVQEHGTFGNNETRICEEECGTVANATVITYADPQTVNRYCVLLCSQSPQPSYRDPSTARCVPICPTVPSLFGESTNFACLAACPDNTYAESDARLCVSTCPTNTFKQTAPNRCVKVCPQQTSPPLFGDPNTNLCSSSCSNSWFRYPTLALCVSSCLTYSLVSYDSTCRKYCPFGYYSNSLGVCVTPCPPSSYGQNSTTKCQGTCSTGYASGSLCLAVCPGGSFGQNGVCVGSCQVPGNSADELTHTCLSNCTNATYSSGGQCLAGCPNGTYADPSTNLCTSSCTGGLYANPTTNKCTEQCPEGYYKDTTMKCLNVCVSPKFADNVTWACEGTCSTGYWGYNLQCLTICPNGTFGYLSDRICYAVANRPTTSPVLFADNNTQMWVQTCPFSSLTFGDTTLKYCISGCLGSTYADPQTRRCETSCQNSSYFSDLTTHKCVMVCPQGYFANSINNKCEQVCTNGYAYSLTRQCLGTCPAPYQGYNNLTVPEKICVLKCPADTFEQSRLCGSGCTAGTYADNSTNMCLSSCNYGYASDDANRCVNDCSGYATFKIADNSTNKCVNLCPSHPDLYEQNYICVYFCQGGTFADPTAGVRKCTAKCTDGLYSDSLSGRCLAKCPLGYWAQDGTNTCMTQCDLGGFADNSTGKCESGCPQPTYADPSTRRCVETCPGSYFGEVNRTCVLKCQLFNYADPLTKRCEPSCSATAGLYAQNTTASCVVNCSSYPNSYADPSNNICVSNCTLSNYYMLGGYGICTDLCPQGLFMENSTKMCQGTCDTGFAEPTSRYCVARCFGHPDTYGYAKVCHYTCLNASHNLYADNSTNLCVGTCPDSEESFSDPTTGNCVLWCPEGYFAENVTRTCTTHCDVGYADNLTRKCLAVCPTELEETFGDVDAHACVRVCPGTTYAENNSQECVAYNNCTLGTWSDPISKYCVARCPSQPLSFGLDSSTSCVRRCPPGFFGDHQTQTCMTSCPAQSGEYRFADPVSQTCVFVCPLGLFGDTDISGNFSCVSSCSGSQLRDNSTQRCVPLCPSVPDSWADTNAHDCVYQCPLNFFASGQADRLCVDSCSAYLTFGDVQARRCGSTCAINYWADNSSFLCKARCPDNPDFYADNTTGTCVYNCSKGDNWTTFADPISRQCVTECPTGYYAQNSTQRCETECPPGEWADPVIRVCVLECTVRPHWYKHSNKTCLYQCPTSPMAYKNDGNHSCVYVDSGSGVSGCPPSLWADPLESRCTDICPAGYFADQVKQICVRECPSGSYADEVDRLCKSGCSLDPEEFRLTLSYGTCVQFCPPPLFADNSTHDCKGGCPLSPLMYAFEPTRQCVENCPPPFYSYLPNRTCLLSCPQDYYAQEPTRSCQLACMTPFFADNTTNRCSLMCPSSPSMYGHNRVCIQYCPDGWFADNSTRLCISQCPTQPITFADSTTRRCSTYCPSSPSLFADNTTMRCVAGCPNGTFADVNSRSCVLHCPSSLATYADITTNACQSACPSPYYSSDLTKECVELCPNTPVKTYARDNGRVCVPKCPDGLYGQNITRTCTGGCPQDLTAFADSTTNLCVSTCPFGLYARNDTFKCVATCPGGSFADNYTRRCLAQCLGTLKLFADSSTMRCVTQCPSGSYGNNQNWTCIGNCPAEVFGYKLDLANLCVEECPPPYFAFVSMRNCVTNCGAGLFGDTATRTCKDCDPKCPTCLSLSECLTCTSGLYLSFGVCLQTCPTGTFSNNQSMTCVFAISCPAGSFGNSDSKSCSTTCPSKQFPDTATKTCLACPGTCSSCTNFAVCTACEANAAFSNVTSQCYAHCSPSLQYSFNGKCFSSCPDGSYQDYTNVYCQTCNSNCKTCQVSATKCSSCDTTYLYNSSCVVKCPSSYYSNSGVCLPCTPNVSSCSQPLTFETKTTTENYQSVIYIKFNQEVKVEGDPTQFISLNLKVTRLMQGYSEMINGGLPYSAQVMPDGTIKITLDPSVSLTNPSFTVTINDPSKITTANGATLQSLEATVTDIVVNSYPAGTTSDAPLVLAGTILSIVMLLLVAGVFLCSPVPVYHCLQAFQMIALFAYITDLPPNFFYFLKQLSMTRLSFLPNLLSGLYQQPPGYVDSIPQRATEVDGQLSFAVNAGSYLFVLLIYLVFGVVVYLASRKFNPNRPLREIFQKIYNIRVKWSLVWDLLWLFGLNVMFCGFMQFRYTQNAGDTVSAVFSLIFAISLPIAALLLRYKYYNADDSSDAENFKLIHDGLKEGKHQVMSWIFFLRRLLFAVVVAATVGGSTKSQAIALMTISILMLLTLLIIRPFQETLRNVMHIANEAGLISLCVGCLYYRHYIDIAQPVGTKIICGTILTGGMIAHLSIAILWAMYRSYHFYKQIYKDFRKTQFYMLYLDEKYDQNLEKELQELNDETGEVEAVEVTHGSVSDMNEKQGGDEGDQIIKLKIRRRRKVAKGGQNQQKELVPAKVRRDQGEYVKLSADNQSLYELEKESKMVKETDYEPMVIDQQEQIPLPEIDQIYGANKEEWAQLKNHSEVMSETPDNKLSERMSPREAVIGPDNIFAPIEEMEPGIFPVGEMEEISSVSNKEEGMSKDDGEHLKESIRQMNESEKPEVEQQNYEPDNSAIKTEKVKVEPVADPILSEFQSEQPERPQQKKEEEWQAMSKWQEMHSQEPAESKRSEGEAPNYVIDLDEQVQPQQEQKRPSEAWNMQIQDLLQEQQKKDEQSKKKKHLLLFDAEDFQ